MSTLDELRNDVWLVFPNANAWHRGAVNPGDTAWVVFENRHGPRNRIIGRGHTQREAWANVLAITKTDN